MSKLCRWLAAILVFVSFLMCVACSIEAEQPTSATEVEATPKTSMPAESSIPETHIPTTFTPLTSESEVEIEPEEILPPKPSELSEKELFWQKCMEEYPVATEIWLQMKSYGWTDAACAGIMGNIMREVGGDTLEYISPHRYNKRGTHYGLCQWSNVYYPQIQPTATSEPTAEEQINFLRYTIINQKTLHHDYGFGEEYLETVTDHKEAAYTFCVGYERPNEDPTRRINNAEMAWKYFVLGEEI